MKLKNLLRRKSSRPTQRLPLRCALRPQVELLESRLVPSTSTIDYTMGFADQSALTATGSASFSMIGDQTVAQLTSGTSQQQGTVLTNNTVGTWQFHTEFTFVQAPGQTGSGGELDFIFANEGRSVGIYFAFNSQDVGSTGITMNGQDAPGASLSGIDLRSQDPMHVRVDYDGTNLTWTIQDTTTLATSPTFTATLKIPSLVGSTANVGFSAKGPAIEYIVSWQGTFNSVPVQTVPTLTSLGTTSVVEGSSGLTLVVKGSNFTPTSLVEFNGTVVGTVFVNPNELIAFVPPNLLANPGTAPVTVFTAGVGTSTAQTFTVTEGALTGNAVTFNATPGTPFTGVVATFSAADTNAPASDFTATIDWGNGITSPGTITALGGGKFQVTGTNTFTQSGSSPVSVTITDIGGATMTVASTANVATPSGPTLTGLSTTSVMEGSSSLTLTLNGANFAPNSIVEFNGVNVATSFVNGNQLIAYIPASLLSHEGTVNVTVFTPGLGNTIAESFTITPVP